MTTFVYTAIFKQLFVKKCKHEMFSLNNTRSVEILTYQNFKINL